jgi:predicted AAA+ superfamily ATPase
MLERTLYQRVWKELSAEKSLVLMAGPRQCGKTTLSELVGASFPNRLYFNWDIPADKRRLLENPAFFEALPRVDGSKPLVVLDEIHKYRQWKNYLKGTYDRFHRDYLFLVTGSGRLDTYQKGGDSLAGRYDLFHLWPLTLAELGECQAEHEAFLSDPLAVVQDGLADLKAKWERLAAFSGFPEPYLRGTPSGYRRWSSGYHARLIREDIRDMTAIRTVDQVEVLFYLLPSRIGSPLSVTGLSEDLKTAYNTVAQWLSVFERVYLTFTLKPWTASVVRSIQKEKKLYLLDYAVIDDPAAQFENMVAVELMRAVSTWNDLGLGQYGLHFVRDKEKREVDFLVADRRKPVLLIETKLGDETPSPSLVRFQRQLNVPAVQLVRDAESYRLLQNEGQGILVAPPWRWLPRLP